MSSSPLSASNDVFVFRPGASTSTITHAEGSFAVGLDGFWSSETQSHQIQALLQPVSHAIIPIESHESLAWMNLHAFELHTNDFIIC